MSIAVDILSRLAEEFYNNECFITKKKFKKHGFTLHHLRYIDDDVERKNYPKTPKGRDRYYTDLDPLVRKDPGRFVLITNGMHTRIDHHIRGLSRLKYDNFIRLVMITLLTEKRRRTS